MPRTQYRNEFRASFYVRGGRHVVEMLSAIEGSQTPYRRGVERRLRATLDRLQVGEVERRTATRRAEDGTDARAVELAPIADAPIESYAVRLPALSVYDDDEDDEDDPCTCEDCRRERGELDSRDEDEDPSF